MIKQLSHFLWRIDPGYLSLKQAFKTILAVAISLFFMRHEPFLTKMMSCLAAGFSMQTVVAKTWRLRIAHVLIFDIAYFITFSLGLLVRDSEYWTAILLVVLGFGVNYIRRFGMESNAAPLSVWTLCFLGTILPFSSSAEAWMNIHGLILGLVVSFIINFLVFPASPLSLFIQNSERFFKALAHGMNRISHYLQHPPRKVVHFSDLSFVRTKKFLLQFVDGNQMLQGNTFFSSQEKVINESMINQYKLMNAYALMVDAYQMLYESHHELSSSAHVELANLSKQFAQFFSSIHMNADYAISTNKTLMQLPNLSQRLNYTHLKDPTLVMVVLNLQLSFDLLNQHINTWLRSVDEP